MLDNANLLDTDISIRRATSMDFDEMDRLRRHSLKRLLGPMLRQNQHQTLEEYTLLDPCLIADGTYYVAEVDGRIAASGGWSRRAALCRKAGDNTDGEAYLDPSIDPAGIRAMYTHPDFARCGFGSLLLSTAELAARLAGFRRARLIATPIGRKLYLARGWKEINRLLVGPNDESSIEASLMEKSL